MIHLAAGGLSLGRFPRIWNNLEINGGSSDPSIFVIENRSSIDIESTYVSISLYT